jgi:hypothetical protein
MRGNDMAAEDVVSIASNIPVTGGMRQPLKSSGVLHDRVEK